MSRSSKSPPPSGSTTGRNALTLDTAPDTLDASSTTTHDPDPQATEESGEESSEESSEEYSEVAFSVAASSEISIDSEHVERPARNIILCFDGTGNKFGQNTNVVRLFRALEKEDSDKQITYYQAGIGTYSQQGLFAGLASKVDTAVALQLGKRVKEGYRFIMHNYRKGDKIFMFGFSRGAYIARALCGMIHKVGMLPPQNEAQLDFAFAIYQATDLNGSILAHKFKETFAVTVKISFLGVWDTVSSVGVTPQSLPYSTHNDGVEVFRHALALDERRARFRPSIWGEPTAKREEMNLDPERQHYKGNGSSDYSPPQLTDVKEVWFAGCHADVGGGYHEDEDLNSLSNISLRWMVSEIYQKDTGIQFISRFLNDIGIPKICRKLPSHRRVKDLEKAKREAERDLKKHKKKDAENKNTEKKQECDVKLKESRRELEKARRELEEARRELEKAHKAILKKLEENSEAARGKLEEEDKDDVLAPIHDELDKWGWWILEYIPMVHMHRTNHGTWFRQRWRNLGRGRHIPWEGIKAPVLVHKSVEKRIDSNVGYTPRATNWAYLVGLKNAIVYV